MSEPLDPPSSGPDEALSDYAVLARRWVQQGWLLRAIALCKIILRLEPDHAPTRRLLSELDARRLDPFAVPAGPAVPMPSNLERDLPVGASERKPASASLLARLGRWEFHTVLESLELRDFHAGELIVEEGTPGDSLFAIVEGSVEVLRTLKSGRRRTVALLGEGDFFGEMSLLSHVPRVASVRAFERTAVLELKRERLERIAQRHPSVEEVLRGYQRERLLDNVVRANSLFRLLSSEQLEALSHEFQLRAMPAGSILLQQGQSVDALFLLLQGQCQVMHQHPEHGEQVLRTLEEGDMFGEIALLFGLSATATVRANTPCMLLRLDHGSCERHLLGQPEVREALSRLGTERLLHTASFLWDPLSATPARRS
jgi:cAMP-dependent protein kinase regulator